MRHFKLSPLTLFKLFVAAAALALGLASARLWPREVARTPAPPAAVAPERAEVTVRDTFAREAADAPRRFEGSYDNDIYGFSVRLPAGMVGSGSTPPAPDHGFGIDLDDPRSTEWVRGRVFPKSYVYVDGSYNSLEWERLDDAADSHLNYLREKGSNVRVRSRRETHLDDIPALRVVALYEEDGVEMVSDKVVAFSRDEDGAVSVVYTLALSTPLSKYERDRPVFEAVWEGCYLHPRC